MIRLTFAWKVNMTCEGQPKGECGKLVVFHSVHHGEQNFLGALLVVFVVAYEVCGHIVCEVIRIDVNESAKQNPKLRAVEGRGCVVEYAIEGLSPPLQDSLPLGLLLLKLALPSLGFGIDGNDPARMVNRAVRVYADFTGGACAIAINDDGRL